MDGRSHRVVAGNDLQFQIRARDVWPLSSGCCLRAPMAPKELAADREPCVSIIIWRIPESPLERTASGALRAKALSTFRLDGAPATLGTAVAGFVHGERRGAGAVDDGAVDSARA